MGGSFAFMLRRLIALPVLLAVVLPAGSAAAASLTADQTCYTEKSAITLTGQGFGPADPIFLQGNQVFLSGTAGADGGFQATVGAPLTGTITPGSKTFTITATDQTTQVAASVDVRVAVFTFGTSLGLTAIGAKRRWSFSGLFQKPGKPIYGHFRFKGKTYSDYRFGVPKGPCGELKVKAPLIPGAKSRPGTWTVQVDFAKHYKATTLPRLRQKTQVFRTVL